MYQDSINIYIVHYVQPYAEMFLRATELYQNDQWIDVTEVMEMALKNYIQQMQICRVMCEKPFDMGWFPDFITSVASERTFKYLIATGTDYIFFQFRSLHLLLKMQKQM